MKSNDWKDRLGIMYLRTGFQYNTGDEEEEETLTEREAAAAHCFG